MGSGIWVDENTLEPVGAKHKNDANVISIPGSAIKGNSTFIITTIICQLYSLLLLIIIIIFTS